MERFSQAAAAVAASAPASPPISTTPESAEVKREKSVSPAGSSKTPEPLQNGPMDLSRSTKDETKEDVNKNLVDVVGDETVLDLCNKSSASASP